MANVTVILDPPPPGVTLYYTIDNGANYSQYTGPFILTESVTVAAVATRAFHQNSALAINSYTITSGAQSMSSGDGSTFSSETLSVETMESGNISLKPGKIKPRIKPFVDPANRAAANAINVVKGISVGDISRNLSFVEPIIDAADEGLMGELQ